MPPLLTRGPALAVGIGARHIRLCQAHVEGLFGEGHKLSALTALHQRTDFACLESLSIRGPAGQLDKVRVIGPCVDKTRVELAPTDLELLGLNSGGGVDSTASEGLLGCTLVGPKGTIVLAAGVFVRPRALILPTALARELALNDGQATRIQVMGDRSRIFADVRVQVIENAQPEFRVGLDDAMTLEVGPMVHAYVLTAEECTSGPPAATKLGSA